MLTPIIVAALSSAPKDAGGDTGRYKKDAGGDTRATRDVVNMICEPK